MISSSCADKDDMVLDGDGSKSGLESNNSCFWLGVRSEREKFLSGAKPPPEIFLMVGCFSSSMI